MFKVLTRAFKRGISEDETFEVLPEHKSSELGEILDAIWTAELRKHKNYALHRSLFRMFGAKFMCLGMCKLLEELLLMWVEIKQSFYINLFTKMVNFTIEISMKMRLACSSLMYRNTLKLSRSSVERTTVGQMVTMLTSDVGKFEQGFFLSHFVWISPIQTTLATLLLYRQIGMSALCGILFLVIFIPIQVLLGHITSIMRLKIAMRTDERVRIMNELLNGIQAIKMYCWENAFSKFIDRARKTEMNAVKMHAYLIGLLYSFEFFITRASVFISLVVYVLSGNKLAPEKIFVVTAIYNVIKPAVTIVFAMSMASLLGVNVSAKRIEEFLRKDKFISEPVGYDINKLGGIDPRDLEMRKTITEQPRIVMKDVSAKWLDVSKEITLKDLNINISSNQLVAIIGRVGSGKSSLLNVLLREMIVTKGEIDIQGRISYASQEPWFFSGTIQQNILFGEVYDKTRYESVTHVCALVSDFQLFPNGDATFVGERGRALSGGQKSRVNLARCIYRKADLYLLDDPLSAVDAKVGKHLYQKCIEKFLSDKICILVTHQLQYLKTADKIIIMKDGTIEESGTFTELQRSGLNFVKMLETIEAEIEEKESRNLGRREETKIEDTPRVEKEQSSDGVVSIQTYWSYFRAGGNLFFIIVLVLLIIVSHASAFGGDYFVAYWVNLEQFKIVQPRIAYPETIQRNTIIIIYAILISSTIASAICFCLYYARFFSRASSKLHNNMFKRLIRTTMIFFNHHSVGRILNRFAKDLFLVDEHIPMVLLEVILIGCFVFGIFLLSAIVEPWLSIPIILLFVGMYLFRRVYINTSRSLKRLESVARSPILAHMTTSLEGLATIRAFNMEKDLIEEFDRLQDVHSSSWYLYLASSRCFGFWLDICCFTFVAVAVYFMLFMSSGMNGGNIGLVITQYIGLIGSLQWGMRQWSELENQMVSVERLLEYTRLETEPQRSQKYDLPENWPNKGKVEFRDLSLRYDPNGDAVLRNISFMVEPGEKIGIVGRTGAGKSSTISALFQLYNVEGMILIDDVDITKIPLEVSRQKISIIPQEPFLFSETMRKNLDPFEEYSDEFLWKALERVEMKETVSVDANGLNLPITEGGHNLSTGQRQLICLARALIKRNRIIIMDEATANVDPYTDALIQKTIRTRFSDCTVLTVAHRLHTVMDSDKILVMRAGRVEEYDHPHVLLSNTDGFLYRLVKATGDNTFASLQKVAKMICHSADYPNISATWFIENYQAKYGSEYIMVKPLEGSNNDQ
ncbi:hypothetical protein HHI36_006355 [Cryptolaemus montrouzieri]|uniref:Multidrug resistance-associated protein lethal(2)03659 n=1 Tax=Cryptolaemus montrouzieri TaxID=559131 RepID=A0ABD2NWX0_9CUCU